MYCVKCGVKLQDGVKACPLCHTIVPVHLEEEGEEPRLYSDRFPAEDRQASYTLLGFMTAMMAAAALICYFICLRIYGEAAWSGYVLTGLGLAWTMLVLPFWFRRFRPMVFIPIDFAAIALVCLYVCLKRGQTWFFPFALPVIAVSCAYVLTAIALLRYIRGGRLFILGGLSIGAGAVSMLIELFVHIRFQVPFFRWSLYSVIFFSCLGLFLILAGIIPPLREYLERKLFIQ
ncbi:MAG: hypothetical protein II781_02950 [Clostridia bacterium]|nr:hypothetical protein [Clostridia bacterium]